MSRIFQSHAEGGAIPHSIGCPTYYKTFLLASTDLAHYVPVALPHHCANQKCPYISKTPLLKIADMYNELVSAA